MFLGSVPIKCLEQVFSIADFKTWNKAFVCYSGTFKIERLLYNKFPKLPIYSNDVSLLPVAFGQLVNNSPLASFEV